MIDGCEVQGTVARDGEEHVLEIQAVSFGLGSELETSQARLSCGRILRR